MSTIVTPNSPTLSPLDPRQMDLVEKIIQKTKEKKIYWNKVKSGYLAQVPTGSSGQTMKLEFTTTQDHQNWTKFAVQTGEGVVLTVDGTVGAFVLRIVGMLSDPGAAKITELFGLVNRVGEGSVERAINALDKL